jgi:hypothetical protein
VALPGLAVALPGLAVALAVWLMNFGQRLKKGQNVKILGTFKAKPNPFGEYIWSLYRVIIDGQY